MTRLQQRLAMDPWRKINRMQEAEYKKSLVDERQAVERANDLYATQLNAQVKDIVDGAEDTAGIKKVEREEANLAFKNFKSESVQKERERQEVLELNRRMWIRNSMPATPEVPGARTGHARGPRSDGAAEGGG